MLGGWYVATSAGGEETKPGSESLDYSRLLGNIMGFLIPGEVTQCLMSGGLNLRHKALVFASLWDAVHSQLLHRICYWKSS